MHYRQMSLVYSLLCGQLHVRLIRGSNIGAINVTLSMVTLAGSVIERQAVNRHDSEIKRMQQQ